MSRFFRTDGHDIIETAILALILFLAVRTTVQNFRVEGTSMFPTLTNGEYILVDKLSYSRFSLGPLEQIIPFINSKDDGYLFAGPQRGDVIVFIAPGTTDRDYIKRVMAGQGDTVEVRNGVVVVNGQPQSEPFIQQPATYSWPANGQPQIVPEGQYFVLGDNRNHSSDSHVWGFVPADRIIGRALVIYWPRSAIGLAPNYRLAP